MSPSREGRPLRLLTLATLLLLLGAGPPGCGGEGAVKGAPKGKGKPAVAVEPCRREPISRVLELTGEAVAVRSVVISATVEGPIGFCPWREGDRVEVEPGEPFRLLTIDRELYRAEVRAAEAAVAVAEARLADLRSGTRPEELAKAEEAVRQLEESTGFAAVDLDRITRLVESGSLPGEEMEKARVELVAERARLAAARRHLEMLEAGFTKTAIAVQEALVKEAEARLELARARHGECTLLAPFSGTITRVHVRPGDMATVKAPLLEMVDLSSLVIRVAVPEAHAAAVHPGMEARVSLDALPGERFRGRVERVWPELDRRMRTRVVELALPEATGLRPGLFARVGLVLEHVDEALTIAQQAVLVTPSGGKAVYLVSGGTACLREVETGLEASGRVQVLGLEEGEQVVITGQERLTDGVELRVSKPPGGKKAGKRSRPGEGGGGS